MGGKSEPAPPTPVNPTTVANAQTASNEATANMQSTLNNTNVNGPYGSVQYTQNPNTNQWTQNTQLSPAEQQIFSQGTQAQGTALGIANNQLGAVQNALNSPVSAPSMQTGVQNGAIANGYNAGGAIQGQIGSQNINQSVQNAEQANYNQQMQLMQPQMQQAAEQQQAQLTAQGLNPNSAAYQNSQTLFNNGQAVQQQQAAQNAVAAGNAEQNTLFGQQAAQGTFANSAQAQANSQNQAAAGFGNTAQEQANQQALANAQLYNSGQQQNFQNQSYAQQLPINEFNALMSSGQVQAPTSTPAQTSIAPTDVTGAYALSAQQQQAQYQAQLQNYQSGLGGLFNLGSAAMSAGPGIATSLASMFSDVRLKRDIERLGTRPDGLGVYSFKYLWDDIKRVGVMAQEALVYRPEVVRVHPSGYLMVDYQKLGAAA